MTKLQDIKTNWIPLSVKRILVGDSPTNIPFLLLLQINKYLKIPINKIGHVINIWLLFAPFNIGPLDQSMYERKPELTDNIQSYQEIHYCKPLELF